MDHGKKEVRFDLDNITEQNGIFVINVVLSRSDTPISERMFNELCLSMGWRQSSIPLWRFNTLEKDLRMLPKSECNQSNNQDDLTEKLKEGWSIALGLEKCQIDSSSTWYELGGTSITAMTFTQRTNFPVSPSSPTFTRFSLSTCYWEHFCL